MAASYETLAGRSLAPADIQTAPSQGNDHIGSLTNSSDTPLVICTHSPDCYKLFPALSKLLQHRQRDHGCPPDEELLESDQLISWDTPYVTSPALAEHLHAPPVIEQPTPNNIPAQVNPQVLERAASLTELSQEQQASVRHQD